MGKIRTAVIKSSAKNLVEIMPKSVSKDFKANQKIVKELGLSASSKVRNKIAGYLVRLVRKSQQQ